MTPIRLLVGLGNPGQAYVSTRHNTGQSCIQSFATQAGIKLKHQPKLHASTGKLPNGCLIAIPDCYMNDSGMAVQAVLHYYKMPLASCLIVYDECDLPIAQVRLKWGGQSSHNGVIDIVSKVHSDAFWRLRLGVDRPIKPVRMKDYVLGRLSPSTLQAQSDLYKQLYTSVDLLADGLFEQWMNAWHAKVPAGSID
ncbi:aminoacyl-tRNA hydrolase [Gammaproteobacteria bacterium]|nr:aminoacyl-tRNA hydrolase [Gammaproteobacteria bacterium]